MVGPRVRRWAMICSTLVIALQSGCGTISTFAGSPSERRAPIYGGSRTDLSGLSGCWDKCSGGPLVAPFILLDLPVSFVADTLLLPFILADGRLHDREEPDGEKPGRDGR
jgi:uncharacterized protein YceK